jgi:hypothetical protein
MSNNFGVGPRGYGAGIPNEEIAEQGQSPDSQPPGHTAGTSTLPPLAIPPRLKTLDDEGIGDPYSPATPPEEVMRCYADPDNLPGPSHHYPEQGITAFGSVLVEDKDAHHYLAVRQHMAKAQEGKKILAFVENRDIDTRVFPYSAGTFPEPLTMIDDQGNSVGAYFAVDQGIFGQSGGRISAATIAAHELTHAARTFRDPQTNLVEPPPHVPHGEVVKHWTSTEERRVIQKVENAVARANGESGDRDTHGFAGFFHTGHIRSNTPVDPLQQQTIERFRPHLQGLTQLMDQFQTQPGNLHEPIPAERARKAKESNETLQVDGKMPVINSLVSSGKSLDEIAAELKLTNQQKEIVRNRFWPPAPPYGQ